MLTLEEIRPRVCDLAAEQTGTDRRHVHPDLRVIRDLHCDSLDFVELIMAIEETFDINWPDRPDDPASAAVFTRPELTLADMAEIAYLRQHVPRVPRRWFTNAPTAPARPHPIESLPFTQLDGQWVSDDRGDEVEQIQQGVATLVRRRRDGMVCVRIPAAEVEFNRAGASVSRSMEAFFIDVEPVSASAYCRFLNTIGPAPERMLFEWFVSAPDDSRSVHQLIERDAFGTWRPLAGCAALPMVLVSWYGANAYALWTTGGDWHGYRHAGTDGEGSALPTEDEWEYAARGEEWRRFPWGNDEATPERAAFGRHVRGQGYPTPQSLMLEPVNRPLGVSPFGLRHMAGNVWQWCANELGPGLRAERGGSWIGPAFLCESGYRRGRVPDARGRCLGFRCVSRAAPAR